MNAFRGLGTFEGKKGQIGVIHRPFTPTTSTGSQEAACDDPFRTITAPKRRKVAATADIAVVVVVVVVVAAAAVPAAAAAACAEAVSIKAVKANPGTLRCLINEQCLIGEQAFEKSNFLPQNRTITLKLKHKFV